MFKLSYARESAPDCCLGPLPVAGVTRGVTGLVESPGNLEGSALSEQVPSQFQEGDYGSLHFQSWTTKVQVMQSHRGWRQSVTQISTLQDMLTLLRKGLKYRHASVDKHHHNPP